MTTGNALLTINMVTLKALSILRNSNFLLQQVSKRFTSDFQSKQGKIGDALRIRIPANYTVRTGSVASVQSSIETYATLTVNTIKGVDVDFTSQELAQELNSFGEQVLAPVINVLASACSSVVVGVINQSQNVIATSANGVYNTAADALVYPTAKSLLLAGAALDMQLAPRNDRICVLAPTSQANLVSNMSGFFNAQPEISAQFRSGWVSNNILGIQTYGMDQMIPTATSGTATTASISGGSQAGPTYTMSTITGTFNAGDYVTVAGVYSVNPLTGVSTGQLLQFVVGATVSAGTSLTLYPALIVTGSQGANCSNLPGSTAVVSPVIGASTQSVQNIVFQKQAIEMAFADLPIPSGAVSSSRKSYDGVSIRAINYFDGVNDINNTRFDVLMGVTMVRPQWSCVLTDVPGLA